MKYTVKAGDSPWKIALLVLGDGSRYLEIINSNNLLGKTLLPGQIINLPNSTQQGLLYIVQGNDNLSTIALLHGITLDSLIRANNILDPNRLIVGQKLNIPLTKRYVPKVRSWAEIQLEEKNINKGNNIDIINEYHRRRHDNLYYLIDDKLGNKLSVYLNGNLIKSYPAIHGKNRLLDDMTVTYVNPDGTIKNLAGNLSTPDGTIKNLAGNLSTPAGIYFTTQSNNYHGAPAFIRRTLELVRENNPNGIPSSIHARTIVEGANTNGCTGLSKDNLKDLLKYIKQPNVPTYILPADNRNRFFIRNGQLLFKSHDIRKTPAYNTIASNPILLIKWSTNGLDLTQREVVKQFASSLKNNKSLLLKDLGINNDSYNELALSALGILGVESTYGLENSGIGNFFRAARKAIFSNNSSPDYKSKYNTYGVKGDNNSVGLTLIRFKYLSDKEKELFKKYNITKDDLVNNPAKAAIATMIKLALGYKDTGSLDKAVSSWNNKPSYLTQVKLNRARFLLYQKYYNGGRMKLKPKNKFTEMFQKGGRFKPHSYLAFVSSVYPALKLEALDNGMSEADSTRWATLATLQAAYESGYGSNPQSANYNYGGLVGGRNYKSYAGYADAYYDMINRKWPDALKAQDSTEYVTRLHHNNGLGIYSTTPVSTYIKGIAGVRNRVLRNINAIPQNNSSIRQAIKFTPPPIVEEPDATRVYRPVLEDVPTNNVPDLLQ